VTAEQLRAATEGAGIGWVTTSPQGDRVD
jgi:hypothetical protein